MNHAYIWPLTLLLAVNSLGFWLVLVTQLLHESQENQDLTKDA